ncbi:MAG TPA: TIGR00645 family protein [Hyphomicrobiaceae bacterium]|nr:TIGR00645 family protein [Hyphomicrobiaceae bacterium]
MSEYSPEHHPLEVLIERLLTASRWLLAPFFLGLALGLIILLLKFAQEFYHMAAHAVAITGDEAILGMLALVDLALTAALVLIVIFSGYENFVSRIDHTNARDWPSWMGSIDFTALKIKLLGSIVAISAIQLLKQFMSVRTASDRDLWWYAGIHVVFVLSSVLLALSDRLSAGHVETGGKEKAPASDGSTTGGQH